MDNNVIIYMLTLGTMVSMGGVSSITPTTKGHKFTKPIFKKLADNFKINYLDAQAIIDAVDEEREIDFITNFSQRLDQLVSDKTISAGQRREIRFRQKDIAEIYIATNGSFEILKENQKVNKKLTDLKVWAKRKRIDLKLFSKLHTNYLSEVEGVYI